MNSAIIRLTLALLAGIIAGFYLNISLVFISGAVAVAILIFLGIWLRVQKINFPDSLFDISVYLLFILLGVFTCAVHLPSNQPSHYLNKLQPNEKEEEVTFVLSINENLKADLFHRKYLADVVSINGESSHGKILLLENKDSDSRELKPGARLVVLTEPQEIPPPLNPHQFNYSEYMKGKAVYSQLRLTSGNYEILSQPDSGLRIAAARLREKIVESLMLNGVKSEELSIIQALLLGQKRDISAETYNNYAAAGAIHILAVSGLHVGILLVVFNFLLAPLKRYKAARFLKIFILLVLLWGFAVIAGLSPSVVRAVTMFSFLAIGLHINRRTSSINSLFLSLMLLLLINPRWIFEVGFQLSYLAVLAILLLQPLLYQLYTPSGRAGKYFWGLLSTTIAAQAGVLPLSLFYFHQFPGLFFLSNLVILPVLGFILICGIMVILLAVSGFLPEWMALGYARLIEILNFFVSGVAQKEHFIFRDISFSLPQVWFFYLALLALVLVWMSYSYRKLILLLLSVILLQTVHIFSEFDQDNQLVLFHKPRETLLLKKNGSSAILFANGGSESSELALVKNYLVGENLQKLEVEPLRNIFFIKDKLLIRIDSSGVYANSPHDTQYLLLTGSPRINLERTILDLKPSIIIADGSNFPFLVHRWKRTSDKVNIPFHYTGKEGALQIDLD